MKIGNTEIENKVIITLLLIITLIVVMTILAIKCRGLSCLLGI